MQQYCSPDVVVLSYIVVVLLVRPQRTCSDFSGQLVELQIVASMHHVLVISCTHYEPLVQRPSNRYVQSDCQYDIVALRNALER